MANLKKEKIDVLLTDLFDRINIQMPENFDKISKFIYTDNKKIDIQELLDDDIAFSFKKWIEKK